MILTLEVTSSQGAKLGASRQVFRRDLGSEDEGFPINRQRERDVDEKGRACIATLPRSSSLLDWSRPGDQGEMGCGLQKVGAEDVDG